ncbi:MAG: chromate transporter [Acidobacteria bacterium]|nr:chromate transporter [Acidobacteriota bacterium]
MAPPLGPLAGLFLRIGNLTFGGGGPTIAAFQRELVTRRRWLTPEQFALSYALSRITPGTNLFAFCTCAGALLRGLPGALAALLAASVPSCLLVAVLTAGFDTASRFGAVNVAIDGAVAASVGILLASCWAIVAPYVTRANGLRTALIAGASFGLSMLAAPILVLALAAAVGWFWEERE